VGKTIKKAVAPEDANVFGKVGTSGPAFEKAVTGKKVIGAGSQGKYFWLVLDSPPHPVMHFGMTGWIHIRGEQTAYTRYYEKNNKNDQNVWPPKFWKFQLETDGDPKVEVAFTDARRFGRVRLVDCPGGEIRSHSPLKENGPDPVVDKDIFTEDYLRQKMKGRHVPVKALLLDQAMISGIGNWVGDEIMFQARMHPEQYSDDFSDKDIAKLYKTAKYVCDTAVDVLGDSDQFPKDWLFHYRWGKGKKDHPTTLPTGEKIVFLTVGGRTSCVVPSLQKKTGRATISDTKEEVEAKEEDEAEEEDGTESKYFGAKKGSGAKGKAGAAKAGAAKRKAIKEEEDEVDQKVAINGAKKAKQSKRVKKEEEEKQELPVDKKPRKGKTQETKPAKPEPEPGRRRSGRLSGKAL
jgi:formamidopyrimidine-DNA glycosylase